MNSIPQKTCAKCKEPFPATLEYFYASKRWKDGFYPYCKECKKKARSIAYWHDRERPSKPSFPDTLVCRKCGISKPANTENFTAQMDCRFGLKKICKVCDYTFNQKPWAIDHRDVINERANNRYTSRKPYFINRYQTERNRILADQHTFKQNNPERVKARQYRYIQTVKGKSHHIASEHRRRSRKLSTGGSYTLQEIEAQHKRQKGKCYYCSKKMTNYHIEHVVPLSRGGTNDISNIVLSCSPCNLKKGARLPHEWPEGGRLL